MRRGKVQGKIWPPTARPCHSRHETGRCKREQGHEEHEPSKNPDVERLNGWHQNRTGCWKDGEGFLTWREFEQLRRVAFSG